jgi:hypothetical protein
MMLGINHVVSGIQSDVLFTSQRLIHCLAN